MFYQTFRKVSNITLVQLLKILLFFTMSTFIWFSIDSSSILSQYYSENNNIIVWWTLSFPGTTETRHCPNNLQCKVISSRDVERSKVGAFLFYGSNISFDDLPLPRHQYDVVWGLYHEESPRNVEELMHEEILNLFNFSSTYSRYSDVPFPLQYLNSIEDITNNDFFIETSKKNSYFNEIAPVMYLQSDCETSTQRDIYVKELMKYINIDSYGACLKNKELPNKFTQDYLNNLNSVDFLQFIARYKFVIAIENGVCTDYITEKFWRAIKVGTIPIYFGAPSIRDWMPNPKSALLLEDFPTPEAMGNQINKLLANNYLYEQYLEHKIKQVVRNKKLFHELNERGYQQDSLKTIQHFECFICQKLEEKRSGHIKAYIVDKKHYNCPKPLSALTLSINRTNPWVYSWDSTKRKIKKLLQGLN